MSPTLLALDAAGGSCSVALWRRGVLVENRFETMTRGQAERLVPMVVEVMTAASLPYSALDALAVTRGPGGFTGVRIGLSTARALALALGRPLFGLDNFRVVAGALAKDEREGRIPLILLDAKRREVYACLPEASSDHPLAEGRLVAPEALADLLPARPLLLAGEMAPAIFSSLQGKRDLRLSPVRHADAAVLARLVSALPLPATGLEPPTPLYLREPDVTLPRGGA